MTTTALSPTSFPPTSTWKMTAEAWDDDFDFQEDEEEQGIRSSSLTVPPSIQQRQQTVRTDLSYVMDFTRQVEALKHLHANILSISSRKPDSVPIQAFLARTQLDRDLVETVIDIATLEDMPTTAASGDTLERHHAIVRDLLEASTSEGCVRVGSDRMSVLATSARELRERLERGLEALGKELKGG